MKCSRFASAVILSVALLPWAAQGQVAQRAPATPDVEMSGRDDRPGPDERELRRIEQGYGLPDNIRNLRDRLPPDPKAIMDQLGLRSEPVPTTDFRGRNPRPADYVEALRPR